MQGTSDPLNQAEISSEEKEFSFKEKGGVLSIKFKL